MKITDSENNRLGYLAYDLVSGETSDPIIIRVTPGEGDVLMSEQGEGVALKAREHGTADPYIDLADGIELSGYTPGEPVDFDLICEIDESLTGLSRVALFMGVTTHSGANWNE